MMGCEHIRNLQAIVDCEVVAYADPHDSSRVNAAKLLPNASAFEDYEQMLAAEKLDVVVIATPNHTHRKCWKMFFCLACMSWSKSHCAYRPKSVEK